MTLQAKYLMSGDWVQVEAHRGFKSQKVKVITIPDYDDDNDYGRHYGCIGAWLQGGDNDFRDIKTSHLRPIPLTPEILEKNGWRYDETNKAYLWKDGNYYISIDLHGKTRVYVCNDYILGLPVDCVHELQHALRLCRIEKTIEL